MNEKKRDIILLIIMVILFYFEYAISDLQSQVKLLTPEKGHRIITVGAGLHFSAQKLEGFHFSNNVKVPVEVVTLQRSDEDLLNVTEDDTKEKK